MSTCEAVLLEGYQVVEVIDNAKGIWQWGVFERLVRILDPPFGQSKLAFQQLEMVSLDVYVTTYLRFTPDKRCTDSAGNPEFCGPEAFRGVGDLLYRGSADGRFSDVSSTALPNRPANKGLGVICADLDGDGLTDVYVAY